MAPSLSLGSDELRIIGHSINWHLNVRHGHTPSPQLNEQEAATLTTIFNETCKQNLICISSGNRVVVDIGVPYYHTSGRIQLPYDYLRLMIESVAYFFGELRSSPAELEIITGLPWFKTSELLSQLQAAYQSASR